MCAFETIIQSVSGLRYSLTQQVLERVVPVLPGRLQAYWFTDNFFLSSMKVHAPKVNLGSKLSSRIGGTFTVSYMGEVTESIGTVEVNVSQYGTYGKAWHVTFTKDQREEQSANIIQHSLFTGQNALISVYPTVTIFTDGKQNDVTTQSDLSGSFRVSLSGETTEAIGLSATHMNITQELQKLSMVDSVLALGDKTAGDIGVYSLEYLWSKVVFLLNFRTDRPFLK